MVMGCGNNFVKYSVIIVNVLVSIVGIAILATSLALAFSSNFRDDIENVIKNAGGAGSDLSSLQAIFYVTAAIGGLIFLTGFLGCCGASCENPCLLGLFFTIILILFLAELGIGIAALAMQTSFETSLNNYYTNIVIQDYINNCNSGQDTDLVNSWFTLESNLHCCGCTNLNQSDYKGYHPTGSIKQCPIDPCFIDGTIYTEGCCTKIWSALQSNVIIVGGVAIGLLVVELFAMIFSCCLCSAIRNKDRNYV